ncbi:MAG: hypothetical protein NVSMB63_05670 [Sediminibacterium sp.]
MGKKFINQLKRIDYLISRRATGSPATLAEKMGLCETTLFAYLSIMKELGTPIRYDKHRQTYYYEEDGKFIIAFSKNNPDPDALLSTDQDTII